MERNNYEQMTLPGLKKSRKRERINTLFKT